MHDPHTNCLKCFPWCYYTITRQAIPMARSYQYQWLCKMSSKINDIWQSLCLAHINSNVYAQFYQNIQNVSRDRASFTVFQNLNLGNASANPKWHLTISWATTCQYQCVCKVSSQQSTQFGHFHFFRIWSSAQPRPMLNVILQSLGYRPR